MSFIETPKYEVIKKDKKIELRKYDSVITAEVRVKARNHLDAASNAFNTLASYIFGDNKSQGKIAMTAPVKSEKIAMTAPVKSEKIAMTAPVTVQGNNEYVVSFTMPSKYTLKTLPLPNDKRVKIKETRPTKYAVIRFSGLFTNSNFEKHKNELIKWLQVNKIKTIGDYIIAGYNAPFTPWFLTRNEVMIKLKP